VLSVQGWGFRFSIEGFGTLAKAQDVRVEVQGIECGVESWGRALGVGSGIWVALSVRIEIGWVGLRVWGLEMEYRGGGLRVAGGGC